MHVEQGDDAGLRVGPHVELRHEVIHGLRALRRHEGVLARGDDLREQRHLLLVCPLVRGRREAAWQRWGSGAPSPLLRQPSSVIRHRSFLLPFSFSMFEFEFVQRCSDIAVGECLV